MLPYNAIIQAFAAWQWWNYLDSQVPSGKALVKINLDETSLCLHQGEGKGVVFMRKSRFREEEPGDEEPTQRLPTWKRRCCLTHVAFICDRPQLQPLLPQVIVGNEKTFTAREFASLQSSCPANVKLVRQKSAWNNEELCAQIIRWLATALAPHLEGLQPVLLLDAAKIHTAPAVLAACSACHIWPILVPAKTTWLLQPLDTDAFLDFKRFLRAAYQKARVDSGSADLSIPQFLACVFDAVAVILNARPWRGVFVKDGFGRGQAGLGSYVKRQLGIDGVVDVGASRPLLEQLKLRFPKNVTIPEAALWRPLNPPAPKAKASPASGSAASASAAPLAVSPASIGAPLGVSASSIRAARTRLQHRQAQVAAEKVALEEATSSASASSGGLPVARGSRLPGGRARSSDGRA